MEIVGSICAVVVLGLFIGLATYECLLWRKRTLAETAKLEAESTFYKVASDVLIDFDLEVDYE